jgi:hypothetical protein
MHEKNIYILKNPQQGSFWSRSEGFEVPEGYFRTKDYQRSRLEPVELGEWRRSGNSLLLQ